MSRLKKLTRSLFSGYVSLAANIVYTLVSLRLVIHYLHNEEIGLWALVSQIGGYIALIDLGMSSSVSRILIDHKDERDNGIYGSIIKTGALAGTVQGAFIILLGVLFSILAGPFLNIPTGLCREFAWLMAGQAVLLGTTFAARIFGQLLFAHQRLDISNYSAPVFFFMGLVMMWTGFEEGLGIYSFLLGQAVMTLGNVAVTLAACIRLDFLPRTGEWGKVTRERFKELFTYGQGVFLISIGSQIINTSQTILLMRLLGTDGLTAVATWNTCTRTYFMMTIMVWRILDYSTPALSEMCVRKEREKLENRIRDIAVLMVGLSVIGGTVFAIANGPFVAVWSMGKFGWPTINNVLLGLWFVVCSIMRIHTGLVGITKDLRFLRFIYLVEGFVFIALNLLAYRAESMTLMLSLSLISTLMFTLPYGLWRSKIYFNISWPELLNWLYPTWQLTWRLVPVALAIWWLTRKLPSKWQLVLDIIMPGAWGMIVLLRYGLEQTLLSEIAAKLPEPARPLFKRFVRG